MIRLAIFYPNGISRHLYIKKGALGNVIQKEAREKGAIGWSYS